jgi:flagellum-specific ATP synthase
MSELALDFSKYLRAADTSQIIKDIGKLTRVTGSLLEGYLPGANIGSLCRVVPTGVAEPFLAEVVGFRDRKVLMMPLGEITGAGLGAKLILERRRTTVSVGHELCGRVINAMGEPMDGKGPISLETRVPLYSHITNPLEREMITEPLDVGIRAINSVMTAGKGQRLGIMSGSGVGKSVLLGMMARGTSADINVIALIGERGREVREFIENDLGEEGLKKSVVVVATSDQSPLLRMRGAFMATAIAEFFATNQKDVLLMMDSVTRFAMAQREIGLNAGEPPANKGYTPSVFALLPKLLERAGNFEGAGSITGFYTVLVEGDDLEDPIADGVRSIVDGHIVLSRKLAEVGHYPAIDILQSTSRVMRAVTTDEQQELAQAIRANTAIYRDNEDLINIGAYREGANADIDRSVSLRPRILQFLRQGLREVSSLDESVQTMNSVFVQEPGVVDEV